MTGTEQSQGQSSNNIVSPSVSSPTAVTFIAPAIRPVRTQKSSSVNAQPSNIRIFIISYVIT